MIESMSLVSTGGFSFKDEKGAKFIGRNKLSKIDSGQLKKIEAKILSELSLTGLPKNIYFEIPILPQKKFQDMVLGGISRLVSKLHPNSSSDSGEIYRLLIDELGIKGEITQQYPSWQEAVSKKGLTSRTIERVINNYTERKGEDIIMSELIAICNDLSYTSIGRRNLIKAFKRYRNMATGSRNTELIQIRKRCMKIISQNIANGKSLEEILKENSGYLLNDYPNRFLAVEEAEAAILNHFIDES